jgi:hypothetical protein
MEWRPVAGYPGYEISDCGHVRSWRPCRGVSLPRILKTYPKPYGHTYVVFTLPGSVQVKQYVHRLVAYAFIGDPPSPNMEVAHNDGDATNNHVANLRWATHKENGRDMRKHGVKAGERHHMSKLNDGAVREIRASDDTTARLCDVYGVSSRTIHRVRSRRIWSHVS